jgi:epoxyqueuosine reductase
LTDLAALKSLVIDEAAKLGFVGTRVGPARVPEKARADLDAWLRNDYHGTMAYMQRHAELRQHPEQLVPGALTVISVRLPYWPAAARDAHTQLAAADAAYISRYALGRDYHKVIRNRLQTLADRLTAVAGAFTYRVFTDSAPVMEVALATQAGLGWKGKHTLALDRQGSWFFLGEILSDLPLAHDEVIESHCGDCTRCLDHCPTGAITGPYRVDARRCISYLTIEHAGPIPLEFRKAMGNRIYGCDDCQLVCPWNRFSPEGDPEFRQRHQLDSATLQALFAWSEREFLSRFEGSPIRRIGYERWQRNLAVALGNASPTEENIRSLKDKSAQSTPLVQEHIDWALNQLTGR